MSATLLHDVLYLMGNRKIVEQLVAEGAFPFRESECLRPSHTTAAAELTTGAAAAFAVTIEGSGRLPGQSKRARMQSEVAAGAPFRTHSVPVEFDSHESMAAPAAASDDDSEM